MEIPGLGLDLGLLLVDYYIARNETARQSHTKTWLARHEGVKILRLYDASRTRDTHTTGREGAAGSGGGLRRSGRLIGPSSRYHIINIMVSQNHPPMKN